jgi:chromate reductase, NAD(P)H dehydrogenase (quinone)
MYHTVHYLLGDLRMRRERCLPTTKMSPTGVFRQYAAGSTNTIILRTLAERLNGVASLTVLPHNDSPLCNGDLEGEKLPDTVRALKSAFTQSGSIVHCSPEYNHGMLGVLKNAREWASRQAFSSPLRNKAGLAVTSSPGYVGEARAHAQMQETLSSALARIVARRQVVIDGVRQQMAIDDLLNEIRMLSLQKE